MGIDEGLLYVVVTVVGAADGANGDGGDGPGFKVNGAACCW